MTKFSGAGPGTQTKDGCSVELYAHLPYEGELDIVIASLKPGAAVLELGCGAGQGSRALLNAGMQVTAVDNSEGMLEYCPPQANLFLADIANLKLGVRFDAVVLPSGLINHVDSEVRAEFVECARRHVKVEGSFFLQRQDAQWLKNVVPGQCGERSGVRMEVQLVTRAERSVAMTLRYSRGTDTWDHSFVLVDFEEQDLQEALARAGFGKIEWLNESKTWLSVKLSGSDA